MALAADPPPPSSSSSSQTITLSPPPPPAPGQYARNHRRSRSSAHFFSDERTQGAFTPLPSLPRRNTAHNTPPRFVRPPTPPPPPQSMIPPYSDEPELDPDNALGLGIDMDAVNAMLPRIQTPTPPPSALETPSSSTVPFPSLGLTSPDPGEAPSKPVPPLVVTAPPPPPRPQRREFAYEQHPGAGGHHHHLPANYRTISHSAESTPTAAPPQHLHRPSSSGSGSHTPTPPHSPITLKNGRPLKPSLKSRSHSSPHLASLPSHTRAVSAPATPSYVPKNVHFAGEKEGLEHVVLFLREQRPIAVSNGTPEETETETETDSQTKGYPFPRMDASASPAPPARDRVLLDSARTSPVPNPAVLSLRNESARHPVMLESLLLPQSTPLVLRGTILVRNVAYNKHVCVRFTLDDWQTISEVSASYVNHLPSLPPPYAQHSPFASAADAGWDRFGFQVRLEDYERKIEEKELYLVARYAAAGQEWWDNNGGGNYRVRFTRAPASAPNTPSQAPSGAAAAAAAQPAASTESRPPPPPVPAAPSIAPPAPLHADLPKRSSSLGQLNTLGNLKLFNYAPPTTSPKSPPSVLGGVGEVLAKEAAVRREREERERGERERRMREKGGRLVGAAAVEKLSTAGGGRRRGGEGGMVGAEFEAERAEREREVRPVLVPAPVGEDTPTPTQTPPPAPVVARTTSPTQPIPIPASAIGEVRRRALRSPTASPVGSGSGSGSSGSSGEETSVATRRSYGGHAGSPPPELASSLAPASAGSSPVVEPAVAPASAIPGAPKRKLFTVEPMTPPSSSSEPSPTHSGPSSPFLPPGNGERGRGGLDRSERSYEEFLEKYCFFRGVEGVVGRGRGEVKG